jgi:hypothetical protein
MNESLEKPTVGNGRDENGRLLPGFTANLKGRPKKKRFEDYFTEEEKEDLIIKLKTSDKPDIWYKLAEMIFGKPKQSMELTGDKDNPIPILNVRTNNSNQENNETHQEDPGGPGGNGSVQNSVDNPLFDSLGAERQNPDSNQHSI